MFIGNLGVTFFFLSPLWMNFHYIVLSVCMMGLYDLCMVSSVILMLGLFFRDDFAGVYSVCDGPALSHGPYLGTVTLCSFLSIVLLSVKACLFTVNSHIEAEASVSFRKQRLHLKKPWGMPVLFLSSVVFALGHTVVAYRTSCRARRKLLFHRVDPEAVSLKFLSSFLFI